MVNEFNLFFSLASYLRFINDFGKIQEIQQKRFRGEVLPDYNV